jgi:hypothetical protein
MRGFGTEIRLYRPASMRLLSEYSFWSAQN